MSRLERDYNEETDSFRRTQEIMDSLRAAEKALERVQSEEFIYVGPPQV